ncbi:MAG: hypothetical protein JSR58_02685 [Verrucomicrobia bacterium]|nr:hypothetical protein [Verrucomicrobiota bacterium]
MAVISSSTRRNIEETNRVFPYVEDLDKAIKARNADAIQRNIHALIVEADSMVIKTIKKEQSYSPSGIVDRLADILSENFLSQHEEIKLHIAKVFRLFIECMVMMHRTNPITESWIRALASKVKPALESNKSNVALCFELRCIAQGTRCFNISNDLPYVDIMNKLLGVISDSTSGVSLVIEAIRIYRDLKVESWYVDALYVNWIWRLAKDNEKLFVTEIECLSRRQNKQGYIRLAVEFLGNVLLNSPKTEIFHKALSGDDSLNLVSFAHYKKPLHIRGTGRTVRHRAVELLSHFFNDRRPSVSRMVFGTFCDRIVEETDKKVRGLLKEIFVKQSQTLQAAGLDFLEVIKNYEKEMEGVSEADLELDRSKLPSKMIHSDSSIEETLERTKQLVLEQTKKIKQQKEDISARDGVINKQKEDISARDGVINKQKEAIGEKDTKMASNVEQICFLQAQLAFKDLQFRFGRDKETMTIKEPLASKIDGVIKILNANPNFVVAFDGYTSGSWMWSRQWDKNLSKKRAEFIKEYFKSKGIDDNRMEAEGKGVLDSSKPESPLTFGQNRVVIATVKIKK